MASSGEHRTASSTIPSHMTIEEIPAGWGRVTIARLFPPDDEDPAWRLDDWTALVFPNAEGALHHGSRGATMPDTVAIALDDDVVATGDLDQLVLSNQYADDAEYYLCLRLREVVDAKRWQETPWSMFTPGRLLHAWDKFHHIDYFRRVDDDASMSYGGDWADLEAVFNEEYPPAVPVVVTAPPSPVELLRAIERDDLPAVRALLARGADPNAGREHAPIRQVEAGLSHARNRFALWDAVLHASPTIVKALLDAGADVDWRPEGGMTSLHAAIANRRFAHVPVLLHGGADPRAEFRGRTALAMAEAEDAETARLLRDWMNRDA